MQKTSGQPEQLGASEPSDWRKQRRMGSLVIVASAVIATVVWFAIRYLAPPVANVAVTGDRQTFAFKWWVLAVLLCFATGTRSDHLRNVCEMYFDRVIQFRDRLKRMLTVCRDDGLIETAHVGRTLKLFDRVFDFEHRFRNQTHHAARFDYTGLNRLGLVELLGSSFPDELRRVLEPKALYRKEARDWVQRVKSRTETLETIVEQIAGILLTSPRIPPRAKGRPAAKAKGPDRRKAIAKGAPAGQGEPE